MSSILEIKNLQAHFHTRRGIVRAVDGVSFTIGKGETLGIVGESGSGKSVTQLSYLKLLPSPPLKIVGGEALYHGKDLLGMSQEELRGIRGNKVAMIFQEPMTSLNPYLKVGTQLMEPLLYHMGKGKHAAFQEAAQALDQVGIPSAREAMSRYPHEFSGGMRQRVMIAMALTTRPELLIADEPTTALDVTVQAQILDLLKSIQKDTGMALILITHDLGVVAGLADRVLVMYAGRVLEEGGAEDIFYRSHHPYTRALLRSTPRIDLDLNGLEQDRLPVIGGAPPDLTKVQAGCPFFERCGQQMAVCRTAFPAGRALAASHRSHCYLEESVA
jgi:oligopeptide transport system ATP-binding protein